MASLPLSLILAVNIACLLLMGFDKWRATSSGGRRVPEVLLLSPVLCFGAPGIIGGMVLFRHKTRKPMFQLKLAMAMALNILTWFGLSKLWG